MAAYRWLPILGRFEVTDDKITFLGGTIEVPSGADQAPRSVAAIGNLISDQYFSGGQIDATITFSGEVDVETGCELILYYEPATGYFVSAGLGGWPTSQFSARYFDQRGFNALAGRGERVNLRVGVPYQVSVHLTGSLLQLSVNGVEVIRALIPFSLPPGQVGIWSRGHHNITITDYRVATRKPTAFVAMQFSPPYNELYQDVIVPICGEFGVEAKRSDDSFRPGLIISDIKAQINVANLVIADITPENSNVFYEVGYSDASRKPTILIAEKGRTLPFDVGGFRTLFYENTISGKRKVEEGLRKHPKAILDELRIPATSPTP